MGRTETVDELIAADRVAALAATLDLDPDTAAGVLPPAWHWVFFNPYVRRSGLGPDGHPRRGGFLPPVPLPRRMWAGGRLQYLAPVPVGVVAQRRSEIVKVEAKSGKRGQLVFVTVRHTVSVAGIACVVEEQDIVYREAQAPTLAPVPGEPAPGGATRSEVVTPDPVLLFRYSALTSNGHRIHYDRPYATGEEGYRDLVVHGPLLATLLHGFGRRVQGGRTLTSFTFRGVSPTFVDRPFTLEAAAMTDAGALPLWVRGPAGDLAMLASAGFTPS